MNATLISLLLSQTVFAKAYGGTENDLAYGMTQTSDGGYVVVGETASWGLAGPPGYYPDILVIKTDAGGNPLWARTFGDNYQDIARCAVVTGDGGILVVGDGNNLSSGLGLSDLVVLKLDNSGNLLWEKAFGGTGYEYAHGVTRTPDNGFLVVGRTWNNDYDFLALKIDSEGNRQWATRIGGGLADTGWSVTETADGGYAMAGATRSFGSGFSDLMVAKLDAGGNFLWARVFGGTNYDEAKAVTGTPDGGVMVAARTRSFTSNTELLLMKLDASGNMEWAKDFSTTSIIPRSIISTADGNYMVAGEVWPAGAWCFFAMKVDPSGNLLWARLFNGGNYTYAKSVIQTADGGFALAGYMQAGPIDDDYDFVVLKLDSEGNYDGCVSSFAPPVTDVTPNSLTVSPSVASLSWSPVDPGLTSFSPTPSTYDFCTPLYEGVSEETAETPPETRCFLISGGIGFRAREALPVKVFAADGRLVYSGELEEGENRVFLGHGVYLWRAGKYSGKAAVD